MNNLWVCNQGINRSKTAAKLFGGDYGGSNPGAYAPVTEEMLAKADKIFFMQDKNKKQLEKTFGKERISEKQHTIMNIPDRYTEDSDELVGLLKIKRHKQNRYGLHTD